MKPTKRKTRKVRNPRYFITARDKQNNEREFGSFSGPNKLQALARAKKIYGAGYTKWNATLVDKEDYLGGDDYQKALTKRRKAAAKKAAPRKPKTKNRTVIKAKKVTVLTANPRRTKRVKVSNGYLNLLIAGKAKSATRDGMKGWVVGKRFFPTGRGTQKLTAGQSYLDLATGYVYRKRAANVEQGFYDASGIFHPIRASKDYDGGTAGETGGGWRRPTRTRSESKRQSMRKASATARAHAEKKRASAAKTHLAKRALSRSGPARKSRKRRNPSAKEQFREFHGYDSTRTLSLRFPQGTPATGLSVLGKLESITLAGGGKVTPQRGATYLCRDEKGKLHLGTTGERLADAPKGTVGTVARLEYVTRKPHLGHPDQTIFFHKAGEENGKKPTLWSDGDGGLSFRGGDYYITPEGIRN